MSGIAYSTLAGSYGLCAQTRHTHACATRRARDILILKPDGNFLVYFAAQRSLTAGNPAADLCGVYTCTADGTLLLRGDDKIIHGRLQEDGSIVLSYAAKNAPVRTRWLASRIDCIWPACRNCRGYQWHFCVRAARSA